MLKNLNNLIDLVKSSSTKKRIAVAAAEDEELFEVAEKAIEMSIADFIFIGDQKKIKEIAKKINKNIEYNIIDQPDHRKAAEIAVKLVKEGQASAVMKGLIHTGVFLKAILNKESGINKSNLISQVSVFDKENGEELYLMSDCAMIIEPNLNEKKEIIENAVELAQKIGYELPKVALLSAIETVNPMIKDTIEAAVLSKMADRGQIRGAIVDGPFALDNAISKESSDKKGIKSKVAGQADILIVPNLQVGNVLHKSLTYFSHKDVASAVMGAEAPIIMTSRTDSVQSKLLTIALSCYISLKNG